MAIEYRLSWIDQWGDAQECDYADRIDDLRAAYPTRRLVAMPGVDLAD